MDASTPAFHKLIETLAGFLTLLGPKRCIGCLGCLVRVQTCFPDAKVGWRPPAVDGLTLAPLFYSLLPPLSPSSHSDTFFLRTSEREKRQQLSCFIVSLKSLPGAASHLSVLPNRRRVTHLFTFCESHPCPPPWTASGLQTNHGISFSMQPRS